MKVSTAALITIKSKSWGYYEKKKKKKKMEDHANPNSEQNLTTFMATFLLRHSQAQIGYSTVYSSQNSGLV